MQFIIIITRALIIMYNYRESCLKRGGGVDVLETYDFKMTSKTTGKLDIRLKFIKGKPIIATVRKFEYKVPIFDILCLNRYV